MPTLKYVTVDVFTGSRFGGNQLAVIPDGRNLTELQMQRVACEFNYSEITFVLPPDDPANSARVRIFTPTHEVPFAGHPNIGTAYVLARLGSVAGRRTGSPMTFEEGAGLVKAEILYEAGAPVGAKLLVPKRLEVIHTIDPHIVASCVSLKPSELALAAHPPIMASVGLPAAIAEVASLEALGRANPNYAAFAAADARYPSLHDRFCLFLYVRVGDDPMRLRARMFTPLCNIIEDPATGSASAATAALLTSIGSVGTGRHRIIVEQGVEMGRPSLIEVEVGKRGGIVDSVSIGGACVPVMRGEIEF